jgi:hypothetical protein
MAPPAEMESVSPWRLRKGDFKPIITLGKLRIRGDGGLTPPPKSAAGPNPQPIPTLSNRPQNTASGLKSAARSYLNPTHDANPNV